MGAMAIGGYEDEDRGKCGCSRSRVALNDERSVPEGGDAFGGRSGGLWVVGDAFLPAEKAPAL